MALSSLRTRNKRTTPWFAALAVTTTMSVASATTPALAQDQGSSVTNLVVAISDAQADIDRLNLEMGSLREAVNKALVDLGDARAVAEQARAGAEEAKTRLNESQSAVEVAQADLNEVARSTYRTQGDASAVGSLSGADAQKDALDRGTYLKRQNDEKKATLDSLERERTATANNESLLRAASQLADERAQAAESAQADAEALLATNQNALQQKIDERAGAEAELQQAQAELEVVRPGSAGTPDHSPVPQVDDPLPEAVPSQDVTTSAEEATTNDAAADGVPAVPAAAAAPGMQAGVGAGPVVPAQSATASQPEDEQAQATDQGVQATDVPAEPGAELSSAAATAISDLARSEAGERALGTEVPVPTLGQIQQAVNAVMNFQGSFDPNNSADIVKAAGMVAATLLVLVNQVNTSDLLNAGSSLAPLSIATPQANGAESTQVEYTRSTPVIPAQIGGNGDTSVDETVSEETTTEESSTSTEPTTETAREPEEPSGSGIQDLATELESLLPTLPSNEDVSTSAEELLGDASREAKIEAVIARAESQLGTPYAWGGGDANGPTKGIRDGGVADSHGDYNKVGFDCSGLTLYAFAGVGISLPHFTGYQYQRGTRIDPQDAQRGDLLFWGPSGNHHVAIYLGDGMMIEAPQSGDVVKKSPVRWSTMSDYAVRLI